MVKSRSNSLWFCWMSYLLRILGGILNRSNSKITLGKSSNNTWIFYGQSDRKRWPPHTHLTVSISWFFLGCVFLTPDNEHMCSETDFTQKRQFSGWLFARGRPLWIIIYKRPVPPHDHLRPQKGHEKCIFETLHNEIRCVLSVKESNFNEKNGSKFSHLLTVRAEITDPPL